MGENKKVLVVDDEPEILNLMAEVLPKLGCEVLVAQDGAEALQLFQAEHPPVVIVDLKMPNMDGLALMRAIKEASRETEILILTGCPDLESAIEAIRLGAFDYLLKPFDLEILLHRAHQALERHRLLSEREALLTTLEQAVRLLRKGFEAE